MPTTTADPPLFAQDDPTTPIDATVHGAAGAPDAPSRKQAGPRSAPKREHTKAEASGRARRKKPAKAKGAARKRPKGRSNRPCAKAANGSRPPSRLKSPHRRVKFAEAMRMNGMDEITVAQKHCEFYAHLEKDMTLNETDKLQYEMLGDFVKHLQGPAPASAGRAASTTTATADVPVQMIYQVPRPEREAPHIARVEQSAPTAPADPL
jgi:hypothetical protein